METKKTIIPAIIAKSQEEFDEKISKVKDHVEIIQIDIMDGRFVPNNSIDFDFKIPSTNCKFEAHLMINDPEKWIEIHGDKVDTILVHYESCKDASRIINKIKQKKKKVGFVLNPETQIDVLSSFLDDIDQILIMTVTPGFYGSPFLQEMIDKIKQLRDLRQDIDIEVDGGITDKTINIVNDAGANMFVSGSYIVKSDNVKLAIDSLKNKLGM